MTSLGVELAAVAVVTVFVIAWAEMRLKSPHVAHAPRLVRLGGALHGLSLGLFIGFVLLPLRAISAAAAQSSANLSDLERTALAFSFAPSLILFILLRRGLLSRAPLIGRPLRAYRRAVLQQQVEHAQRALHKLTALDAPGRSSADSEAKLGAAAPAARL